ncbi:MAG TPA: hypothetical protein VFY56_02840 [Propionibacteriaceae bacterium]|nr:hypothetical protein [Propionibacteriaceae bacterium]
MELTTVLIAHRHPFSNSISLDGNALDDALDASLAALTADIEAAVPSYLGIQLTIRQNGQPVTLTRIAPHRTATTSLQIPLTVLGPRFDPDSRVTFYAAAAGAFVDLAADLSYALHVPTSTDRSTDGSDGEDRRHRPVDGDRGITLDADAPPSALVSGVSGLSELSTINRAIGVLIDHGHHPDRVGDILRCDASSEGLEPNSYAARLLGRDRARPRQQSTTSGGDVRR